MAFRMAVFALASVLLVTARVSSGDEETISDELSLSSAPAFAPVPSPAHPPHLAPSPSLAPHLVVDARKECPGVCSMRCGLHSRPNLCNRACMTCCIGCKCVPPGTAGNREMCGACYINWTTHGNRTNKCP